VIDLNGNISYNIIQGNLINIGWRNKISDVLKVVGCVVITISIFVGFSYYYNMNVETYNTEGTYQNQNDPFKSLENSLEVTVTKAKTTVTIIFTVLGSLLGLFFLALGRIVELLEKIVCLNKTSKENVQKVTSYL